MSAALLAKTPAILTVCDTNGRVLYQNPAAVAYAGPRADASPTTTSASYLEELFALEPELLQEVRDAVCAAGAGDAEWCGEGVRVPRSLAVHLPCVKLNSLKVTTTGLWDSWLSSPAAAGSPAAIAAQLPAARTHAPPPAAVTADYSSTNIAADQQRDGAMLLSAELLITGDGGLLDEGVVISRLQQRRSTVVPASPPCSPAQQRSGPQAPQVSAVHWESMTCDLSCVQPRLVGRAAHVRSLELGSSCGHPSVQSSPGEALFAQHFEHFYLSLCTMAMRARPCEHGKCHCEHGHSFRALMQTTHAGLRAQSAMGASARASVLPQAVLCCMHVLGSVVLVCASLRRQWRVQR